MALLNTGCLISTTQVDVTGVTTGYASECFVILAAGLDAATSDRCVTVPSSGSLPSLYPTQTIPDGQVVFVEDVGVPVIAASGKWIGFDKRVLRKDSPIMVELYTWGFNNKGQLGDGTITNRSSPGTVAGAGTTWSYISAKSCNSSGIKTDGTLWTWGNNLSGELGDGTTTSRSSPGTVAGGGTNWCFVNMGGSSGSAIKTDGTLWTWGSASSGRLGNQSPFGRSSPGTTAGGGTNWCAVSMSSNNTAGLKTDGTLWTWGGGFGGINGDGTTTARSSPGTTAGGGTNWCAVSSGGQSMAAIKTDGRLWTWGYNNCGVLGDGTTTSRSSPGTTAGGGTTWCAVSVNAYVSHAIKTDGTLWTWGCNFNGNLGDGTTTNRSSPGTVAGGGTNWCSVSVGNNYSVAIKTDGTVWTWGLSDCGSLGDGTLTNRSSPTTILGGSLVPWTMVSAGGSHALALSLR